MTDSACTSPLKTALVLGGGGARAAYQAGVLDAVRQVLPDRATTPTAPFDILCGTSAGAINAAALAARHEDFGAAVDALLEVWRKFRPSDVYRTDVRGALGNAAHWVTCLAMGWIVSEPPRSLFDNDPLRDLLAREIDFVAIEQAVESGALEALAINASSYTTGLHTTFYRARHDLDPWTRSQRRAAPARITLEHLIASSAIPFVFPAVQLPVGQALESFGDGAMRQTAPISPAIRLGATRVLVIGAGQVDEGHGPPDSQDDYPTLGQIGGHVLSSIFLDGLASDIERLERVNDTVALLTPAQCGSTRLRPIDVLVISPSERLDALAIPFIKHLPRTTRSALRLLGATGPRGSGLASYLLFDQHYTDALVELGRRDALARKADLVAFFRPDEEADTMVT